MTHQRITLASSNILNNLIIHVVGTRLFIRPLEDLGHSKVRQINDTTWRVVAFYNGNQLNLLVNESEKSSQIVVEEVEMDSLRRYSWDVYLGRQLILEGIGRVELPLKPMIEGAALKKVVTAPFPSLLKSYVKLPDTFPTKETWRRDGRCPPDDNYVSIVIPNCNGIEWLKPCIRSVYAKTDYPFELIIVDDGSTEKENFEGLKELIDEVMPYPMTVVLREKRKGFADACNQGIKLSSGRYVMLLNNDTTIQTDGWLKKLIQCACDENIGIVGCRLLFPDGRLQHGGGKILSDGAAFHPHHSAVVRPGDFSEICDVDFVTFAAVLIKRQVIDVIGGFDYENFPHGYEDVDYCVHAWEAGIHVRYCGTVTLTHYESATDKKLGIQKTRMRVFQDKWRHKGGRWR